MEYGPFETATPGVFPSRQQWDATAADLVATMLERWHLIVVEPFVGGAAASVLRVLCADGSPAVLKVGYPHREAVWEAVGLEAAWPYAPTLLRQDAWTWSLLLEDLHPGTPLGRAGMPVDESLAVGGELLAALHARPVPAGIPSLTEAMNRYATDAAAQVEHLAPALEALGVRSLVDDAIARMLELSASGPDPVLLHGDFNPGNILLDDTRGWLAVDMKPMHGDPAFDLWPLVVQLGPHVDVQLHSAAAAAGVDRDRAAGWGFARTGVNLSWYVAEGSTKAAEAEADALRRWAEL